MSKTRRRYSEKDYYDGGGEDYYYEQRNKKKERRFERALKTRNIDDLVSEEGSDPNDFDYIGEMEFQDRVTENGLANLHIRK